MHEKMKGKKENMEIVYEWVIVKAVENSRCALPGRS